MMAERGRRRGRSGFQLPWGLRLAVAATGLAGGLIVGSRSIGGVPALGPLLDPVHGILASASTAELEPSEARSLSGSAIPSWFATTTAGCRTSSHAARSTRCGPSGMSRRVTACFRWK